MAKTFSPPNISLSITTVAIVFVVAVGLILLNNYRNNQSVPLASPITATQVETRTRLTNPGGIDKIYVINDAVELRQVLKVSTLSGFDPANQILLGVVSPAQSNSGPRLVLKETGVLNNQVRANYELIDTAESSAQVISYPTMFFTINRTDLPQFSPIDFVFTNLTAGATQTISRDLTAS